VTACRVIEEAKNGRNGAVGREEAAVLDGDLAH
jgi:hypothetical protein